MILIKVARFKMLIFFSFYFVGSMKAQYTIIPDPNFEQYLIDFSIDTEGLIDGQVLTSDINGITYLEINESGPIYTIQDLTGIQDFVSLETLYINFTNCESIDFGNLEELTFINIDASFDLVSLNLSGCANLNTLAVGPSQINAIELPDADSLEVLICSSNDITFLDLSPYQNLTQISVNNNALQCLNVANGTNMNISAFNATGNPELEFIVVDNVDYSNSTWTNIDPSTTFTTDAAACEALSLENLTLEDILLYPNPTKDFFTLETTFQDFEVSLFDAQGKLIQLFNKNLKHFDISARPKGVYFINVKSPDVEITKTLIID